MITCPVCEHQQASGSECEVCGRRLEEGRGTDAPVAPLEGLELTSLDAEGAAGAAPLERVPGMEAMEATRFEPSDAPATELVPDMEATLAAPVEVAPDVTPDVERGQEGLPDDGPTFLPLTVTCRYCRTEAHPADRLCARCGMKLPRPEASAAAPARGPAAPRLCSCGTPVTRSRCPSCGARNEVA